MAKCDKHSLFSVSLFSGYSETLATGDVDDQEIATYGSWVGSQRWLAKRRGGHGLARIWLKLDTAFYRHPKIRHLSDSAFRLHVAALLHCKEFLTDGRLSRSEVRNLLNRRLFPEKSVRELESAPSSRDAPLWRRDGDGWIIHDFLAHNLSKEQVEEIRRRKGGARPD